jgi:hypothetical protein
MPIAFIEYVLDGPAHQKRVWLRCVIAAQQNIRLPRTGSWHLIKIILALAKRRIAKRGQLYIV